MFGVFSLMTSSGWCCPSVGVLTNNVVEVCSQDGLKITIQPVVINDQRLKMLYNLWTSSSHFKAYFIIFSCTLNCHSDTKAGLKDLRKIWKKSEQ